MAGKNTTLHMDLLYDDNGYRRNSECVIYRCGLSRLSAIARRSQADCTVPFRFPGLEAIGVIFFLLNIVLFIFNVIMISLRFYCHPETFKASILHPTERLFLPAAVVSFGTILLNISQYGPQHAGHWLNDAIAVCFWIDCALALLSSMGVYLVM